MSFENPFLLIFLFSCIVLVSIIVIFFMRFRGPKKSLSYRIRPIVPLISVDQDIEDRVNITFDHQSIGRLYLVLIQIQNNGREAIRMVDYEKWFEFTFQSASRVVSAEVIEKYPVDIQIEPVVSGAIASLTPNLLNPGDKFTLKIVVSSEDELPEPRASARIAGISHLDKLSDQEVTTIVLHNIFALIGWVFFMVLFLSFLVQGIFFILGNSLVRLVDDSQIEIPGNIVFGLLLILIALFFRIMAVRRGKLLNFQFRRRSD
ncbi:MAG: hypothetical protein J5I90_15995 [Caldilineales bacterium]|nr:hypothetical protein [Caldilineales bacterium]